MSTYTRTQITEAIEYWRDCLRNEYGMTDQQIDEGVKDFFSKIISGISKAANSPLASSIKNAIANTGIADFANVIAKTCKNKYSVSTNNAPKIKIITSLDGNKYNISDIGVDTKEHSVIIAIDPRNKFSKITDETYSLEKFDVQRKMNNVLDKKLTTTFNKLLLVDIADAETQKLLNNKSPEKNTSSTPTASSTATTSASSKESSSSSTPVTEDINVTDDSNIFNKTKYQGTDYSFDRSLGFDLITFKFVTTNKPTSTTTNTSAEGTPGII